MGEMPAQPSCPACGRRLSIQEDASGETVSCPHCAYRFTIGHTATAARTFRFTFPCGRCASVLEAASDMAHRQGRCPTCGAVFIIPEVDTRTGLAAGSAQAGDDGQLPTPMHAYATAGEKAPRIRRLEDGRQAIVCPRCRRDMPIEADSCASCGLPFTIEGAAQATERFHPSSPLATAALVVGVFSIPTFCLPALGPVAIILGTLALLRYRPQHAEDRPPAAAIAGLALGIVALGLFLARIFLLL
jgi:DNA-directed RNA polymerase subunit RPC12/RpoP